MNAFSSQTLQTKGASKKIKEFPNPLLQTSQQKMDHLRYCREIYGTQFLKQRKVKAIRKLIIKKSSKKTTEAPRDSISQTQSVIIHSICTKSTIPSAQEKHHLPNSLKTDELGDTNCFK